MSTTNADSVLRESAFVFRGLDRYRLSLSAIGWRDGSRKRTGMGAGRAWRKATKAATPPYIQEVGLWRSGPFKSRASGDE